MGRIQLKGVRKAFGDVVIIPSIDLDIGDGEFVVFVGPSGCGKSTLLRIVAGLEEHSAGHVRIAAPVFEDELAGEVPEVLGEALCNREALDEPDFLSAAVDWSGLPVWYVLPFAAPSTSTWTVVLVPLATRLTYSASRPEL